MVSTKLLRDYGYNTVEDYFQSIADNAADDNMLDVWIAIAQLSKPQSVQFLEWIRTGNLDGAKQLNEITLQIIKR